MSIVLFMDGVLRTDTKVPIFEGVSVYRALNNGTKVVLAVDDEKEAVRWCKEHRFIEIDGFIDNVGLEAIHPHEKDFAKVQKVQSQGPIFLVVTCDLELAKICIENGIRVFLFLHPKYLSHKFRPDGREGRRSWDDIQIELDRQIELIAEDPRL